MWSEEQKAFHRTGLGGNDIASIAGYGYSSQYKIFLKKLDLVDDIELNRFVEWGGRLESKVAEKFAEEHPEFILAPLDSSFFSAPVAHLSPDGITLRHPENKWWLASPDRLLLDRKTGKLVGVLEIKTANQWMAVNWGEDGTDEVPDAFMCQPAWYIPVLEAVYADYIDAPLFAYVAVLIGGNDYREYPIPRTDALDTLIANLEQQGRDFWFNHVKTEIEPPMSADDADALNKRYPKEDAPPMNSTPELDAKALKWKELAAKGKAVEAELKTVKNEVRLAMKDAEALIGTWGKITWKKKKANIAYGKAVKALGIDAATLEKYRGESYRALNPYFKKGD